jgi:2-keto-4-pentenoate hydratase/2-oxohepta-3-ene-1,7-dioic acid hydratase in catechol pathway
VRTATIDGRMVVHSSGRYVDVERASDGRFSSHPPDVFEAWPHFAAWAAAADLAAAPVANGPLGAPSPSPRQVFAIGLNYADHAAESGVAVPDFPPTFTKFPSAVTGPEADVVLPSEHVDWEAELVVVVGRRASRVSVDDAWSYVAGLTVGQDYSERRIQMLGAMPQFSLGKSYPGFAPTGPELVTVDELPDPLDLAVTCEVNGELVQSSSTSNLVFPVAELVSILSGICTLLPGDLIFTGTPGGVGMSRTPPRYLRPGDQVLTRIAGVGEMQQRCVAPATTR